MVMTGIASTEAWRCSVRGFEICGGEIVWRRSMGANDFIDAMGESEGVYASDKEGEASLIYVDDWTRDIERRSKGRRDC
jgi:hypothetical protein